jgi:hypothetical protein
MHIKRRESCVSGVAARAGVYYEPTCRHTAKTHLMSDTSDAIAAAVAAIHVGASIIQRINQQLQFATQFTLVRLSENAVVAPTEAALVKHAALLRSVTDGALLAALQSAGYERDLAWAAMLDTVGAVHGQLVLLCEVNANEIGLRAARYCDLLRTLFGQINALCSPRRISQLRSNGKHFRDVAKRADSSNSAKRARTAELSANAKVKK